MNVCFGFSHCNLCLFPDPKESTSLHYRKRICLSFFCVEGIVFHTCYSITINISEKKLNTYLLSTPLRLVNYVLFDLFGFRQILAWHPYSTLEMFWSLWKRQLCWFEYYELIQLLAMKAQHVDRRIKKTSTNENQTLCWLCFDREVTWDRNTCWATCIYFCIYVVLLKKYYVPRGETNIFLN